MWKIFKKESANRILGTHLPRIRKQEDEYVWSKNEKGVMNAKDAYSLLMEKIESHDSLTRYKKSWVEYGLY